MRSRVVFPEPEGPRRPRNSRCLISRSMLSSTTVGPKRLVRPSIAICIWPSFLMDMGCGSAPDPPFEHRFDPERHESHQGQQGSNCKGSREGVVVVENLVMQRHLVGQADDVS